MTAPSRFLPRDLAAALAIVFIWGSNFLAMKFALRDFTPFQLGAAASWAASNIVTRKAQAESGGFDPLALVVWASLVPIVPSVLLSLVRRCWARR